MRRRYGSSHQKFELSLFHLFLALLLGACLSFVFLSPSGRFLSSNVSFSFPTPVPPTATFEVGFSPRGQSLQIILGGIRRAEESIIVAAFSFTSRPISAALLEAHRRGVDVRVIADARANATQHSAVPFLADHGVPVRINDRYAIFHHKFMVFDGIHLQTGSFNYSAAAVNRNTENVLLLRDVPEIAGLFVQEWQRLWAESREVRPRNP